MDAADTRGYLRRHTTKADQKSDDELGPPLLTRRTDERDYLEREEHERQRAVRDHRLSSQPQAEPPHVLKSVTAVKESPPWILLIGDC